MHGCNFLSKYACLCICVYLFNNVCIFNFFAYTDVMYACMYVCMYSYIIRFVSMHRYIFIHSSCFFMDLCDTVFVFVSMHACMYVCMHACMLVCSNAWMYA